MKFRPTLSTVTSILNIPPPPPPHTMLNSIISYARRPPYSVYPKQPSHEIRIVPAPKNETALDRVGIRSAQARHCP